MGWEGNIQWFAGKCLTTSSLVRGGSPDLWNLPVAGSKYFQHRLFQVTDMISLKARLQIDAHN